MPAGRVSFPAGRGGGRCGAGVRSYHDIAGDGGSDILRQVGALRARIDERLAGVRHLVAVASGKGGVGKSTIALGLARALAAAGRRTAVLDADLNGPSQARLAGVSGRPPSPDAEGRLAPVRDGAGVGVMSLGALIPPGEPLDFESVAEGDSHVWRATREFSLLGQLLAAVDWGRLDELLIDLPPGAERAVQYAGFFGPRTVFVLVTLPSALSLDVVARSAAALRGTPNRVLGWVENMAGYWCAGCGILRPLFPEAAAAPHAAPRLGRIPFDPELAAPGGLDVRLDPARPAVAELARAAERIVEQLDGVERAGGVAR